MVLTYLVKNTDSYLTIREVFQQHFAFSSRLITKLKQTSSFTLNGQVSFLHTPIFPNDTIQVFLDFEEDRSNIVHTKMKLTIIAEDEAFLVLDKPAGIAIHPSMSYYDNTLSNGVAFYFDEIGLPKKTRPVNRLDHNTSGIVIFAKNQYVQEHLVRQMESGAFEKKYLAVVEEHMPQKQNTINAPIARQDGSIIARCVNEKGDRSITHYTVQKEFKNYSLVEFRLETGRTHQIRVHTSYLCNPIVGDTLYGHSSSLIDRQALHCYELSFIHPISHVRVTYISALPKDIQVLLHKIAGHS